MGLFDNVGSIAGQMRGKGHEGLIAAAAQLIASRDIGGLSGLMDMFNKRGHGDAVQSWVSTGENKQISPDAVQDVLGCERVQQVANSAGVSEREASQGLSTVLPQLVDKLTPDGKLPEGEQANDTLAHLAGRFLGR